MPAGIGAEFTIPSSKVLRDEGFVMATRDGKAVLYQLESSVLSANGGRAIDLGCCYSHLTEALNSSPGKNTILNNR